MTKYISNKNILLSLLIMNVVLNINTTYAHNTGEDFYNKTESSSKKIKSMYIATTEEPVYNKPNGYILNTLNKGTLVEVVSQVKDSNQTYSKIKYGNNYGFVKSLNITEKEVFANIKYISMNQSPYCNVYSDPKNNSNKIMILTGGTPVEVIKNNGRFTEIKYNNKVGYIHSKNLSNTRESKNMYITDSNTKIYISPSKDSDIIGTVTFGEEIELVKLLNGEYKDFAEIKINNGSIAYVESKHLSENKPIEQNIQYADITKGESFKVYEEPNDKSKEIGEVPGGTKLITNGIIGNYTSIIINGKQAYIKTEQLSSTPKTIECFISNPNTAVFKNTSTGFDILGMLNYKEIVQVQQYQPDPINKYVKIKYSHGNKIVDAYVEKNNISKQRPEVAEIGYIDITTCEKVNLYKNKEPLSNLITELLAGEKVKITNKDNNVYEVIYNGEIGYVESKYISLEQKYIQKYVTNNSNVYDSPQWETPQILGTLKKGDTVEVMMKGIGANKEFSLIRYKGVNGYIKNSEIL